MDFGGSAVTGMHVSCVAKLRDHYGLEKRLVKVHEPYQMLGLIEDDLKEAIGIDVTPLMSRTNMFGFDNRDWKPWTFNGLEVLVPEGFRITRRAGEGRHADLPEGRYERAAERAHAEGRVLLRFDHPPEADRPRPPQSRGQRRAVPAADRRAARRHRGGRARGQHRRIRRLRFAGEHRARRHRLRPGPRPHRSQGRARRRRMVHADGEPPGGRAQDFRTPGRGRRSTTSRRSTPGSATPST